MHRLFFCLLLLPAAARAQFPLTPAFTQLLDSFDLRLNHPAEPDWKLLNATPNDYLRTDHRVSSRAKKLEVRFTLVAEDSTDVFYQFPHIRAGHLAMNLASNDPDALTTVLSLDDAEMDALNADWARVYLFRPKRSVSAYRQAQLVASYRAERGMTYTLLLFNQPPADLLDRQLALAWRN